ncbi:hypothetical protein M9H77_08651 [Catharanthus roseus]|uniref:Uncharacterized protein n=1 Tax=Catharanthus roseus TaxID=4058 RepID=A0ACC0BYE1_CATRO|nr:hypothetical protein M9H77_08651 [Catharanthus roseus]
MAFFLNRSCWNFFLQFAAHLYCFDFCSFPNLLLEFFQLLQSLLILFQIQLQLLIQLLLWSCFRLALCATSCFSFSCCIFKFCYYDFGCCGSSLVSLLPFFFFFAFRLLRSCCLFPAACTQLPQSPALSFFYFLFLFFSPAVLICPSSAALFI